MFEVITDYSLAEYSWDYKQPLGNLHDNTKHLPFNTRIEQLISNRPICMIDFGCAGGGIVEDFIDRGHLAIGLDGSDASYLIKRACWGKIPNNLFLCDCARPFQVLCNSQPFKADVITSFEFFEHIYREDIPKVCDNIKNLLNKDGFSIHSIALFESGHHVTWKDKEWWFYIFEQNGLRIRPDILSEFEKYQLPHFNQLGERLYIVLSL